ncbi:hypothetical protein [Bradyrhizobium sp. NP1]|uniref:hypothetical protein n=1 Tax=Bradyrhizobium sp. NP1 TaxID=3049772 RepID=UPI0025A4CCD9|nr:hypothetical protein [Bradyrhizobium sp. NP1]WJR76457.1 hypothetical protein QOU61_27390 [Bradyrhizobium sp. NP1]
MANESDSALTGAAFELANAGYSAMGDGEREDDAEMIGSDNLSLREAVKQRSLPDDDVIVREYTDGDGKPAAENEAITLERAARDRASTTTSERLIADAKSAKDLAARVDAFRAEALANDPDAAEFYGFEPPKGQHDKAAADEKDAASPRADAVEKDAATNLDSEIAKAIQHPQVQLAIGEKVAEAEQARRGYLDGLAAATQIAQASFFGQFPEFANMAPESVPGALESLSRQDPAKFARIQAMIASTEQLLARQQQESRRQTEVARRNFLAFARSEDARLETMLKGEPRETQRAVTAEIMASARASGIEPAELNRLFSNEPLMRNAVFQRMMYDAGKYRLMMKARGAVAARPLPPVQRPGMAATRAERDSADIRTLNARLSSSGDLKDAVALYKARQSSKR